MWFYDMQRRELLGKQWGNPVYKDGRDQIENSVKTGYKQIVKVVV